MSTIVPASIITKKGSLKSWLLRGTAMVGVAYAMAHTGDIQGAFDAVRGAVTGTPMPDVDMIGRLAALNVAANLAAYARHTAKNESGPKPISASAPPVAICCDRLETIVV